MVSREETAMTGRTLDRYTLVEKLGSGGMGDVFKGHHPSLDQYRAIKVLPPSLSQQPDLVERFLREARRCAALKHPHIVRLEHVGKEDGLYYMVLDYVEGISLAQLIEERGPLPVERGLVLALQVCEALAYAHEQGIVHRDVKPANILVGKGDHVYLSDFGIARGLEADEPGLTAAGASIGTPEYMAPEQVRGDGVDERSDLYSLGVVLYETFTGELPFSGRSKTAIKRQHLERRPESPRFYRPELPGSLEAIILRALAKEPEQRYPSAAALRADLEQVLEEVQDRAGSAPARPRLRDATTIAGAGVIPWSREDGPPAGARSRNGHGTGGRMLEPSDSLPTGIEEPRSAARREPATVISGAGPGAESQELPPVRTHPPSLLARLDGRQRRGLAAAGVLALLLAAFAVLQGLGSAGAAERLGAEKGLDPRTGTEYGSVLFHGIPVFIITRASGELSPAQRAQRTADRLQEILAGHEKAHGLDPDMLVAFTNARNETVLAHRHRAEKGETDPEDVIVTVDRETARNYAHTDPATLARWWRDMLRDQVRLARGRPPVSTYGTPYGRVLDRVFQQVEEKRRGSWVPPVDIKRAIDDLPQAQRSVLATAWRAVPARRAAALDSAPVREGLLRIQPAGGQASDASPGYPAGNALDGNPSTAWECRHGARGHWMRADLPAGATVSEVRLEEGQRSRSGYQLRIKQAKLTFSDGSTRRMWRRSLSDPLRVTMPARATRWVRVDVEQVFANRHPHESHVFLSELALWGQ